MVVFVWAFIIKMNLKLHKMPKDIKYEKSPTCQDFKFDYM